MTAAGDTMTAPEPAIPVDRSEPPEGMGLHERIWLSYRDIRGAIRGLIAERPSEARLLFFVLMSDVIFFFSWTLSLVVAPGRETKAQLPIEIALMLIVIFLFRTATLYAFSGIVGAICRMIGGKGAWWETRTAVFWASLAAAPVGVLCALIGAGLLHAALLEESTILLMRFTLGFAVFVYFPSAAVAEAQRFQRTSPVFIVFSVLAVTLGGILMTLAKG